jgi:hypothetical protein
MALPRLSAPSRAALHSARSRPGSRSQHAWRRDLTAWLALGLSIAAVMFVVARASTATPRPTATPTATPAPQRAAVSPHARTTGTAASDHGRVVAASHHSSTAATKTKAASRTPTTPTTVVHMTTVSVPPSSSPDIADVNEQWTGVLSYPDDVATSYSFTTTGGSVTVTTTLGSGSRRLSSSLQCADAPAVRASHAASTTIKATAGSCTYDLQFVENAFQSGARASYRITAEYPAVVPAS